MSALIIESFPEALHAKLQQIAASHRRSISQETIHLIELGITTEFKAETSPNVAPPDTIKVGE